MNQTENWIAITHRDNIPLREGRAVQVGERELAIFNLGDRFLAVNNRCPHQGGPLCDGIVSGTSVICPLHAWKIDLETGMANQPPASPACVPTYRTRVENGIVMVDLTAKAEEAGVVA